MKVRNNKRKYKAYGFTLIEVIIYIALLSLIMGTCFVTAFQLIESSNSLSEKSTTQEEVNFVMRKINFLLKQTDPSAPISPSSGVLSILTFTTYDGNQITIWRSGEKIEIKESSYGNIFLPLTTDNVKATNIEFKYEPLGGITSIFIIDGKVFTTTNYFIK